MKIFVIGISLILTLALISCESAKKEAGLMEQEVSYNLDTLRMKGFLAYDKSVEGKRPGVLVVHEWWGHNEYARKRVRMLAEMGYIALAVDMYGDGKQADHPDDAGKFAGAVMSDIENAKARFMAAMDFLKEQDQTDTQQIAAIGYCFGGGVVLHMARMGLDLKGVASFHGSIATRQPAQPGEVKAKILVCNGAEDNFVTAEQIEAFKKEMDDAGADYTFISYENAKHSFTNPDADKFAAKFELPLAYNAAADQKSWNDMKQFFGEIFK